MKSGKKSKQLLGWYKKVFIKILKTNRKNHGKET